MEKINGLEKINLDIDFEPEMDLEDDIEEMEEIDLKNIYYIDDNKKEYEFEDTLELDINEVRENA